MASIFTEENVQRLFGNEAAENEPIERLKEYFFKTAIYNKVVSEVPLRILVGHKGIGKSALFKIAISEDIDHGNIPLLIRPDDVLEIAKEDKSFLELIREWKKGLIELLSRRLLQELGVDNSDILKPILNFSGKFINWLIESVKKIQKNVSLDPSRKILIETFLKFKTITIYVDDLDRGWEGRPFDIKRISALLNAVRDLSSDNEGLRFRIALRSDVYFLVRTSDESTDKIEGSVVWHSWINHEILVLLIKRIETFFGRRVDEKNLIASKSRDIAYYLESVMQPKFTGHGLWENAPMYRILMSLIRKRPRDLVKLCSSAAKVAYNDGSSIITTAHFQAVFEEYSQGRIQDTVNEYKTELSDIERLLFGMKPSKRSKTTKEAYSFTTADLMNKIDNVIQSGRFRFSNGKEADKKSLAQFMYKINFLTAWKKMPDGKIQRKYFEENRYLNHQFADFGYSWEIHPAYRWALQPDNIYDLFDSISED